MSDEVNQHIATAKFKMNEEPNDVPKFQRQYEYAQLLVSVGRQPEALEHLQHSYNALKEVIITDEIWKSYFLWVGNDLAAVLDYTGDIPHAAEVFQTIMSHDPKGYYIGDYAVFLHRRKREFDKAQTFYLKALELYPDSTSIHLKYAGFLRHVKRDISGAEKHYYLAVKANPTNADALGSLASFLHGVHNKVDEAETHYRHAVDYDDTHANNLCNYGLFMSEERKNFTKAEEMYKRAIAVNDKHCNSLYNYAVMLDTHLKRKTEAEHLYRRALDVEPRHAYALYNLAVLLEEVYFTNPDPFHDANFIAVAAQKQEVMNYYKRAVDADPKDPGTLADYGRFLLMRLEEPTKAEPLLAGALRMDPGCETAMYNLAIIFHRHKQDCERANTMLRLLLERSPQHFAGMLQLSRVLAEQFQKKTDDLIAFPITAAKQSKVEVKELAYMLEESCELYEKAIAGSKDPGSIMAEYLKLISKFGTNKLKLHAVATMGVLIKSIMPSYVGHDIGATMKFDVVAGGSVPVLGNNNISVPSSASGNPALDYSKQMLENISTSLIASNAATIK
jgi:tetratricopeptide (TPR) repeat protein